jgi:Putative adhesin
MLGSEVVPRRRQRAGRTVLGVAGAVLAVLVAATGARLLVGVATLTDEHAHASYPLEGRRLVIEGSGSASTLRISAGQPGRVEVDRVVHHDLQRPELTQRLDGDRLVLGARCPTFIVVRCDASYDLRVPAAIDVQVRNPSGDIRLTGVQGSVDLRTVSGSITLQGGSRTARLRTDDGSIRAGGLRATDVDASSDSGRIAIELIVVPRQVVARTSDGNVQIVVPAGPRAYHVDARSTDGKVTTALPTDPGSPMRITASSGSGDVVVRRAG